MWLLSWVDLQWGDALECEFGGHPDEAAHYVTGLMVYDYLNTDLGGHPLRFAEAYYETYPKVALGHFPPGFYAVQALWFTLASASMESVLALQSLTAALIASLLVWTGRRLGIAWLPLLVMGGVFCLLPLVHRYVAMVMSDLLLSLGCLLASICFGWYLQTQRWVASVCFGLVAAATIMVKGSGLMLALVPPVAIALSGKWALLKRWSLWLGAVPVLLICFPWMLVTYKITQEGMVQAWSVGYMAAAVPYFAKELNHTLGPVLLILLGVGLVGVLRQFWVSGPLDGMRAVLLALPVGLAVTYLFIPVGFEQRYWLPAVAPFLVLAALGWEMIAGGLQRKGVPAGGLVAVGVVATGLAVLPIAARPTKVFGGFDSLIQLIHQSNRTAADKTLVVSDARGEGAVIAGLAMGDARPGGAVLRGSKVLSTSDWMGRGYQLAHETDDALAQYLVNEGIEWIVVDESVSADRRTTHHDQMTRWMEQPGVFERVQSATIRRKYGVEGGEAHLYQRRAPASEDAAE